MFQHKYSAVLSAFAGIILCWSISTESRLLAQKNPIVFGSSDDLSEQLETAWWRRENTVEPRAGFSLIGAQWRFKGGLSSTLVTRLFTARIDGAVRTGIFGTYRPNIDEAYDALRTLTFLRLRFKPDAPFYVRAGPLNRVRLGEGQLVNFYNSTASWDDRTIGIETAYRSKLLELTGFTDNILLNGVTGGRLALTPFFWGIRPSFRSFRVGLSYVTDLGTQLHGPETLQAWSIDVSFKALQVGEIFLRPIASASWFSTRASGIAVGGAIESMEFIDLGRFSFRTLLHYNADGFISGYFGPFYLVQNERSRILSELDTFDPDKQEPLVGTVLQNASGGNDLEIEFRLLLFSGFEFWYNFKRHYGSQSLSEYHLRLFANGTRFRVGLGTDRGGLGRFTSLFKSYGDQTLLRLISDFQITGKLWAHLETRYSYERIANGRDGNNRYLVQRRFEPVIGTKFSF